MPYIGRELDSGNYLKLDDISSSFNGSTTTFNLTAAGKAFFPGSAFSILVNLAGVAQEPESAYQINNATITFATAPVAGDQFFCIVLGVAHGVNVPGNGTVNGAQIAKPFNYDGYFYLDDANNRVGVGTATPQKPLHVVGEGQFDSVRILGDLTVDGSTTTLDTVVTEVDKLEVGANNSTVGVAITQSGSGDILNLYDGSTEVFSVADGGTVTASGDISIADKIIHTGDTNTAIRFPAADTFTVETNGSERLRIDSSGRLLLGPSSNPTPSSVVIQGNSTGSNSYGLVRLTKGTTSPADGDALGLLAFGDSNHSTTAQIVCKRDGGTWTSGSSHPTRIEFYTTPDGSSGSSNRMHITSAGSVGIGTNSPQSQFEVFGSSPVVRSKHSTSQKYTQINHNGTDGYLDWSSGGLILRGASNAERLRITSDGKVYFGNFASVGAKSYILKETSGDYKFNIFASESTTDNRIITVNSRSNVEALRISANAIPRVGINTTGPNALLTVGPVDSPSFYRGTVAIKATNDANNIDACLYLEEASGAEGYILSVASNGELNFHNSGASPATLKLGDDNLVTAQALHVTHNITPTSGRGVEIFEASAGVGQVQSFNRTGGSWDELRLKGSEVAIYTGTSNGLGFYLQSTQSTLYGTSDGILNLDSTDAGGSFMRFKQSGTSKGWVGCSEGIGTGGDQDDLGIRAVDNIFLRAGGRKVAKFFSGGAVSFHVNSDSHETFRFTTQAINEAKLMMKDAGDNVDIQLNTGGDSWFNGGKLGVGTNNPQATLQVGAGFNSNNGTLLISADNSLHNYIRFTNGGATETHYPSGIWYQPSGRMELRAALNASSSNAAQLVLASNGNVGVGIATPTGNFEVNGNDGVNISNASRTGTNGAQWRLIPNSGGAGAGAATNLRLYEGAGATEVLVISKAGQVTIPNHPAFNAAGQPSYRYMNTWQNTPLISWNYVDVNTGSHFSNSTGRFTAPVAGKYFFIYTTMFQNPSTADFAIKLHKNGTMVVISNNHSGGGQSNGHTWNDATVQSVITLAAGDYVTAQASGGNSSTCYLYGSGNSRYGAFSGFLIG